VVFSAIFAAFSVVGSYLLGLGLALLLIQNFPLRGLFRVLLIIPWILSSIVTIVSGRWIIQDQRGSFLTALFDYESFTVTFETGIDHNRRFDAHITVYGETKEIRLQYDMPHIRQLPTRLFLAETQGEAFEEREIRPTFTDAYTMELLHFYEVVSCNTQPKMTAEDFLYDLDLFEMIIDALRE